MSELRGGDSGRVRAERMQGIVDAAVRQLAPIGDAMLASFAIIGGSYIALRLVRDGMYALRRRMCVIDGVCSEEYADVMRAILANVGEGREDGCQVAVTRDGELIVDVAVSAGWGPPVARDSLMCVFSSGKVIESLVMTVADSQGWLRLGEYVHRVWPGFATGDAQGEEGGPFDKRNIKVSDIMAHRAGLALVDPPLDFAEIAGFDDPLSPGAEKLREHLAAQPIRYSKPGVEKETLYMAVTRVYHLAPSSPRPEAAILQCVAR